VTARIRERIAEHAPVEVVEEPVAVPIETKPEEPPASPPAAVIAMPEPFRPVEGHMKAVARRRQGNEAQLRLF
jgi:hypothetical protein